MENSSEFIKKLRFDYRLTQEQLALKVGVTKGYIALVEANRSKLSKKIYDKIVENFPTIQKNSDECITIKRISVNQNLESGTLLFEEFDTNPISLGINLIQNILKVSNVNDLKVINANGDSMESTIYNNDDLLVDFGRKNFTNGGIFLFTINNDWFIKRLRLKINGDLDIISDNKDKYPSETKHLNDDININIIGRVIKNLSRGL